MRAAPDAVAADRRSTAARPRLRSDLHVELRPGRVLLFSQTTQIVLRAQVFVELAPWLDGTHSVEELTLRLTGKVSIPEVYFALNQLTQQGLLSWQPAHDDPATGAWADLAGLSVPAFADPVELYGVAGADTGALRAQLDTLAVPEAEGALLVVLANDPQEPELREIDRAARAAGRPWLLLAETGRMGIVGPLFVPGETACWSCLARRLSEARQAETWLAARAEGSPPRTPRIGTPASRAAFAAFAATQLLLNRTPDTAPLKGKLLLRDALTFTVSEHAVPRRPHCPDCGTVRHPGPRITLSSAPGPLTETGGAEPLEALIDPVTGIVHSVDEGLRTENEFVYTAIARHFFPMFKDEVKVLQQNLHGRSGGKGNSARAARTGALGEAVERYSGVWTGDWEPSRRGIATDLPGAVPLEDLLNFSEAQYADRMAWNRALKSPHQVVPDPLDPETPIDWTPAWSLTHDSARFLPAAYCWYGHPDLKRAICFADSNGCAAASTRELALMKGLFELIERDAVALWWYPRAVRPGLDIAAFGNERLDVLQARYDALGRDVWALDLSTEFGLKVVVALSARREGGSEDIIFGFGAGADRLDALETAVAEMNQSYVYVSERGADGSTRYRAENAEMLDWMKNATRADMPWLLPAPHMDLLGPETATHWSSPADAVGDLTRRLGAEGIEVIALDQTRPDVGVPVMRAVAPGLRHFWRRLGPGRLYDAPVKLGWVDAAPCEADLNPFSVFI